MPSIPCMCCHVCPVIPCMHRHVIPCMPCSSMYAPSRMPCNSMYAMSCMPCDLLSGTPCDSMCVPQYMPCHFMCAVKLHVCPVMVCPVTSCTRRRPVTLCCWSQPQHQAQLLRLLLLLWPQHIAVTLHTKRQGEFKLQIRIQS